MKEQGKLIPEQGKKTKGQGNGQGEQGSLISPRKYDFSIDKIDRREVHLYQLQSLMKCAANGGLEPIVTDAAKYIYDCSLENILTNPPVGQINLEQWVLI